MRDPKIQDVKGIITLTDGSTSAFTIGRDGIWTQWAASTERLGQTVEALEAMTDGLVESDRLASSHDEDEDEGDDD